MDEASQHVRCMVCGSQTVPYCVKTAFDAQWRVVRCTTCGHGFVANRPTVEQLRQIYASDVHLHWSPADIPDYEQRPDAARAAANVARFATARGRSLDVGSGDGTFSYHLARRGYQPVLIDLDPRAKEAAKQITGSEFRPVMLEELDDPGPFGAIMMSQVLEHALDPMDWLARSAKLLDRGGVLAVLLPNFGGVYRLLGERDPMLCPPVHLNFFTARSLRLACEKAGLRVAAIRSVSEVPVNPAGSFVSRMVRTTWNKLSVVLNGTGRGIILHVYAVKD